MSYSYKKEDIRVTKSHKALLTALPKLLERRPFRQLTVNDICEEAQLSRTAFYAHFQDKYDLFKYWLKNLKSELIDEGYSYCHVEKNVNGFIRENKKLIKNAMYDADDETLEIVHAFVLAIIDIPIEKDETGNPCKKYISMSTFCAGGIVNCLLWQIRQGFPAKYQLINPEFYRILDALLQKPKSDSLSL